MRDDTPNLTPDRPPTSAIPTPTLLVRRKLPPAPAVHSLADLLAVAESGNAYANIDMPMLWRIVPQLRALNGMVGMRDLKQSLFYQIIFYLQHLVRTERNEYLHTMILGPPGVGKCLGWGTPVIRADGTIVPVQTIGVGDRLMGDDSRPRTVQSVTRGRDPMVRIQRRYWVNEMHILSLVDASCTVFVDMSVQEFLALFPEEQQQWHMYRVPLTFPKIPVPYDPYLIGYLYIRAKPSIHCSEPGYFTFQCVDYGIANYFGASHYLLPNIHPEWEVVDTELCHWLQTSRYELPTPYWKNAPSIVKTVLAGMYDAAATPNRLSSTRILRVSQEMYPTIERLHTILCLAYTVHATQTIQYRVDDLETHCSTLYEFQLEDPAALPTMLGIFEWEEPTDEITPYQLETVEIETGFAIDDYFGFELDGNGRFVLGDGLVTHNTTIARIIGDLYTRMGILSPDGPFRIAKREDFIAEYLGRSAIKTRDLLESCLGGVLFIDEVYALGPGKADKDSFSKEAIDTLNAFLSEHSQSFCCIVAGYEEEVRSCFLSVNRGLERRFQWVHRIRAYTSSELAAIFFKIVADNEWTTDLDETDVILAIERNRPLFQNNGGDIENLVTKCKIVHGCRIFSEATPIRFRLTRDDLASAIQMIAEYAAPKESPIYLTMYN